jgi:hypothetical protein
MADNTDTSTLGDFSIQDTINAGAGSQELLNDLFSDDGAGADPNDITPITKTDDDDVTKKVIPNATDDADTDANKGDKDKKPTPKPDTSIADFLSSATDDDDDDDDGAGDDDATGAAAGIKAKAKADADAAAADTDGDGDGTDGDGDGDGDGTPFQTLSKELTELGVFSELQEGEVEITTGEQFLEKFQAEKQNGASQIVDNFIGQFGEDYQNAFDAIYVKGADPREYFTAMNKVKDFAGMDLTEESNQKAVLKQALTDQGFEGEDIDLEIERLNNYGDLETVAGRHHKVLIKKEAANLKNIEEKAKVELQQKLAIKNEYTTNVRNVLNEKLKTKGFDGIPLNPALANELHDFLLVDKYKTPTGETLTDFDRTILELKRPENHSKKVKLGLLLKLLEKDPTLSTIQKAGITKKTNTMFKEVVRHVPKSKTANSKQKAAPTSWFKH